MKTILRITEIALLGILAILALFGGYILYEIAKAIIHLKVV